MNGVEGLELIDRAAIHAREPHIAGAAALYVPSAGIISAEDLVKTYARLAIDRGAHILTHARATSLNARSSAIEVGVEMAASEQGSAVSTEIVEANCVVNCAGLYADEVAAMLGFTRHHIYPVRGEYAELIRARVNLVNGLVYPLPHPAGMSLGVHLTRTVWDTVLVGPTARYVEEKDDYERNRISLDEFAESAKALLPEIKTEDLRLGYSGLRAKLVPPREPFGTEPADGPSDFVITHDPSVAAAIHLIGIESPGLTSALAIARYVSRMVAEVLN
jgi:glycerol-3-phosphate dehydrogenase